jgi:hypothetical protein
VDAFSDDGKKFVGLASLDGPIKANDFGLRVLTGF